LCSCDLCPIIVPFMRFGLKKVFLILLTAVLLCDLSGLVFLSGCGEQATGKSAKQPAESNELGPTIGSFVEIFASDAIVVRGYALVGGLNGTGSSECPPHIREYLEKYIQQHISGTKVNIEELIRSSDTAVVMVEGVIPPAATKSQKFDVRIAALPGTSTTSLEGGRLYGADLYEARLLGISVNPLASAEGPVYVDLISSEKPDLRSGFVLGGGSVLADYKINLMLRKPDFRIASEIRNRINERFEYDTAWAISAANIELRVPLKFINNKVKFIRLVRATYLMETPQLTERRIIAQVRNLVSSPNKNAAEISLEAIGNATAPKLTALLNSSDAEVRFRAARCMLNLGDALGQEELLKTAGDKNSPYRTAAIEAIVKSPAAESAASMLRGLLRDEDFAVRLTAYQELVRLKDVSISRKSIANSFYLDQITTTGKPAIYASRSGEACIDLFTAPIFCRSDMFIETPDGAITINAPAGQQVVTIIRKHPRQPETILRLNSSLDLADIIQTLCKEPEPKPGQGGPGLGVPYSTLVYLLKQMVDSGAVNAEFHAGPLPKQAPARYR
jgi:hypothetical protein